MKIAFVVTDLNMGGITASLYNFCRELSGRGHEITLIDLSGQKPEDCATFQYQTLQGRSRYWKLGNRELANARGLKKIRLAFLAVFKKLTNHTSLWNKLIFRKNKTGPYDVAVAFRQSAPCYFYVLKRMQAKAKIGFVHGDVAFMEGNEKSFLPYMKKFHRVAYVSDAVKEGFIAKYPALKKNAATVYNMFDTERILQLAKEQNPVPFQPDRKNIVTVARLSNWDKQVDWIPQICKLLRERCRVPFHWYVVGDGPDMETDRALAEELGVADCLTFLGRHTNPFCILKDADFSVLTSKTEAFPMTVMESLILQKPVVSAFYPAAKEAITDGQNGMILPQSVDEMAEGIKRLLENQNGIADAFYKNLSAFRFSNETAYRQFMEAVE